MESKQNSNAEEPRPPVYRDRVNLNDLHRLRESRNPTQTGIGGGTGGRNAQFTSYYRVGSQQANESTNNNPASGRSGVGNPAPAARSAGPDQRAQGQSSLDFLMKSSTSMIGTKEEEDVKEERQAAQDKQPSVVSGNLGGSSGGTARNTGASATGAPTGLGGSSDPRNRVGGQKFEKEQHQKPKDKTTEKEVGSMFECNICLDSAREPVVTQCGHLYCWKCIYKWMQQPRETLVCPVCKSGITQEKLTPIFTKDNSEDPRKKKNEEPGSGGAAAGAAAGAGAAQSNIPNRPSGQRSAPEPNTNFNAGTSFAHSLFSGFGGGGNGGGGISFGYGFFPFFALNFTWDDISGLGMGGLRNGNGNAGGPETTRQSIFRIAMIVIFCAIILLTFLGSNAFFVFQNLFLNLLPLLFFGMNFVNTGFWRGQQQNGGQANQQNAQQPSAN